MGVDVHVVMVQTPGGPVATPLPHPFEGVLNGGLSRDVTIMGAAAATVDSTADNTPPHVPAATGSFKRPPSNRATVTMGSATVMINGKAAARHGDLARTCNDPNDVETAIVQATGTVLIG